MQKGCNELQVSINKIYRYEKHIYHNILLSYSQLILVLVLPVIKMYLHNIILPLTAEGKNLIGSMEGTTCRPLSSPVGRGFPPSTTMKMVADIFAKASRMSTCKMFPRYVC